jgi:putative methionine-R-sulfoxide reductase with GAF domain
VKIYRSSREVLAEIERALSIKTSSPGTPSPLDQVVSALQNGRHYLSTTIYLLADDRLVLQGMGGQAGCPKEIRVGEGIVGKVAQTGKAHIAADVTRDSDYRKCHAGTRSEIAQPVRTPGRVLAVINVESAEENALGREDQLLLKQAASRLALFLTGPGKYLIHRWRIAEAASSSQTQPGGSSGQGSARGAVAGRRTAK